MNLKEKALNEKIGTKRDFEKTYTESLAEFEKTEFWFSVKDYLEGKEFMEELKAYGNSKVAIGYSGYSGIILKAELKNDTIKYHTSFVKKFSNDTKRYKKEV